MTEEMAKEMDYITLWCKFALTGKNSNITVPLTSLAEAGCENAIKMWCTLSPLEKNITIDKYLSADESTLSHKLLFAKAIRNNAKEELKHLQETPFYNIIENHGKVSVSSETLRLLSLACKKCAKELKTKPNIFLEQEYLEAKHFLSLVERQDNGFTYLELETVKDKLEEKVKENNDPRSKFYLARNLSLYGSANWKTKEMNEIQHAIIMEYSTRPFCSQITSKYNDTYEMKK